MLAVCIENLHKHFDRRKQRVQTVKNLNLEVFALISNFDLPASRFDDVLEMVDIVERSAQRIYSAGT